MMNKRKERIRWPICPREPLDYVVLAEIAIILFSLGGIFYKYVLWRWI